MKTTTHTHTEIASDFALWMEYVDPSGIDSEESFEAMTMERKLKLIEGCFGPEPTDYHGKPAKFSANQQVVHVDDDGMFWPATVLAIEGDRIEILTVDGQIGSEHFSACYPEEWTAVVLRQGESSASTDNVLLAHVASEIAANSVYAPEARVLEYWDCLESAPSVGSKIPGWQLTAHRWDEGSQCDVFVFVAL